VFKPRAMSKVRLLLLDSDTERFTREIQELGLVEFTKSPVQEPLEESQVGELTGDIGELQAKAERMIGILEDARSEREEKGSLVDRVRGMIEPEALEPREVNLGSADEQLEWCSERVNEVYEEVERLGNSLERISDQTAALKQDLSLIRELLPVKVPLRVFRESELTGAVFFHISPETLEPFTAGAKGSIDPVEVRVISGTTELLVMAMCLSEERTKLLTQIHRFEGEIVELPSYDDSPREVEARIEKELSDIEEERSGITERIFDIASEKLEDLKVTLEILEIESHRLDSMALLSRTESVAYMEGWIPERDLTRLDEAASSCTDGRYVLRSSTASGDGDDPPTSLENPKPFSSFEWITKMYGMPNYHEVDPTIFVAPTFAVFFGTCLTDAGYGIILALVSFFILRKAWGKELGTAFTLCGLGTILMGWLTGGWFGNIFLSGEYGYGPQLKIFEAPWINPIEDPVSLLVLALMMGIVHLMLGHVTAIMSSARKGKLLSGIITHVGWLLSLSFGTIFILWFLEITTANAFWKAVSSYGAGIGVAMGVIGYTLEREGSARVAGVPQFLYDILGHVADVISYSRLLALGISTGVNALLIDYIIVGIVWQGLESGGGFVQILIFAIASVGLAIGFVLLHLVNMGLNCLTGFVHTMRLEFAEYFGKFYEGDGDEFEPLRAERSLTRAVGGGAGR